MVWETNLQSIFLFFLKKFYQGRISNSCHFSPTKFSLLRYKHSSNQSKYFFFSTEPDSPKKKILAWINKNFFLFVYKYKLIQNNNNNNNKFLYDTAVNLVITKTTEMFHSRHFKDALSIICDRSSFCLYVCVI